MSPIIKTLSCPVKTARTFPLGILLFVSFCQFNKIAVNRTADRTAWTLCIYSDATPWLSDLQEVADMATSQYVEMKGVCEHLKRQNESLRRLVKQLVSAKDDRAMCDLGT